MSLKKRESPVCSRKFDIKKLKGYRSLQSTVAANTYEILNNGDEVDTMRGKVKSAFNNTSTPVFGYASREKRKELISATPLSLTTPNPKGPTALLLVDVSIGNPLVRSDSDTSLECD